MNTQSLGEESIAYNCSTLGSDASNNAEVVRFFATAGTQFRVKVKASSIGGTSPQKFAVAILNGYLASGNAPVNTAPTGLKAASDLTPRVLLTWNSISGATYDIQRKKLVPAPADTAFKMLATVTAASYSDTTVESGGTYLYRVRARNVSGLSNYCVPDIVYVMTTSFTDDPSVANSDSPQQAGTALTRVKPVHVTELRAAIDQMRAAVGLSAYAYTDTSSSLSSPGARISTVDLVELRNALDQARAQALAYPLTDSDPNPASNQTLISKAQITELREGVR